MTSPDAERVGTGRPNPPPRRPGHGPGPPPPNAKGHHKRRSSRIQNLATAANQR